MAKTKENKEVMEVSINGQDRVIIENVEPQIDGGLFPVKRTIGETVRVTADIYAEGHENLSAYLFYRTVGSPQWNELIMRHYDNDRWEGHFIVEKSEGYEFTIKAWVNRFKTCQIFLKKKVEAQEDVKVDLQIGITILEAMIGKTKSEEAEKVGNYIKRIKTAKNTTEVAAILLSKELFELSNHLPDKETSVLYDKIVEIAVERPKALFSTWYEFFPRSWGENGRHGTFKDAERLLPSIAGMGFDVVYLPPIHPVGHTHRKGKNNLTVAQADDVGSPWAIGGQEGGHKAIDSLLGTFEDFQKFIQKANDLGMEIAMDLTYQCSPDHPYVKQHPQWFFWRPDGTIQYAENPPKKYQDVLPLNFETADWRALWQELYTIVTFWVSKGVRIFRVDNPHTKPFGFWKWLIAEVKKDFPDVLFLSESFTRPKLMKQLAKLGFSQSYTYFTWRTSKAEFIEYMTELTKTSMRDYFRPNFWPNTPDILPYHLQNAPRQTFITRLILAATLSSNYGIYGPAFELCVSQAMPDTEEYLYSEKYELKNWDWDQEGNIKEIIKSVNQIRKENPALQTTWNLRFCEIPNDHLLCYLKTTADLRNVLFIAVNLHPTQIQSGWVKVPIQKIGIKPEEKFKVVDLIGQDEYYWQGEWNYIELNPYNFPAHIFRVEKLS